MPSVSSSSDNYLQTHPYLLSFMTLCDFPVKTAQVRHHDLTPVFHFLSLSLSLFF